MIRLHDELEGDPTSSAHREAWQRWHAWLAELATGTDSAQRARAERIGSYIVATFEPPERSSSAKAAGIAGIAGAGGIAGYEAGQLGSETAASAASVAQAPASGPEVLGADPGATSGADPARGGIRRTGGSGSGMGGGGSGSGSGSGVDVGGGGGGGSSGTDSGVGTRAGRRGVSLSRRSWWIGGSVVVAGAVAAGAVLGANSAPPHRSARQTGTASTTTSTVRTQAAVNTQLSCTGAEIELFDNDNVGGVLNGGKAPSFSTGGKPYCLVEVTTYHWNNGQGASAGTVVLSGGRGPGARRVGPLRVRTTAGEAANVNWVASLPATPPVVIDGTYTVSDSQPSTWSQNSQSHGLGFTQVWVRRATSTSPSSTTAASATSGP